MARKAQKKWSITTVTPAKPAPKSSIRVIDQTPQQKNDAAKFISTQKPNPATGGKGVMISSSGSAQPQGNSIVDTLKSVANKLITPNPAWERPIFAPSGQSFRESEKGGFEVIQDSPTIGDVAAASPILGKVGIAAGSNVGRAIGQEAGIGGAYQIPKYSQEAKEALKAYKMPQKLEQSKEAVNKVLTQLDLEGQKIIQTAGLSIPRVAKVAKGVLPPQAIQTEIINSVKVKMGLDYLGRLFATNPWRNTLIGLVGLSLVGGYPISTSIAAKSMADAQTGINVALKQAIAADDEESINQLNELSETLDDGGLWDTIKIFMPGAAIPASIQEFNIGVKAAKIQQNIRKKKQAEEEDNSIMDEANALQNRKEEENKIQRDFQGTQQLSREQEAAKQRAFLVDYQNNKNAEDEKARLFWAEQQKLKDASEEENRQFWAQYEANKEAYWLEYKKKKENEEPSKLNFGIL